MRSSSPKIQNNGQADSPVSQTSQTFSTNKNETKPQTPPIDPGSPDTLDQDGLLISEGSPPSSSTRSMVNRFTTSSFQKSERSNLVSESMSPDTLTVESEVVTPTVEAATHIGSGRSSSSSSNTMDSLTSQPAFTVYDPEVDFAAMPEAPNGIPTSTISSSSSSSCSSASTSSSSSSKYSELLTQSILRQLPQLSPAQEDEKPKNRRSCRIL